MATKKLTTTQKFKAMAAERDEQKAHADKLVKELAQTKSTSDMWYQSKLKAEAEVEQMHTLLDSLPNSIPRQSDPGEWGARQTHALVTRFAAWLARR